MTAPFEKAKLAGYRVECDTMEPEVSDCRFLAIGPQDEDVGNGYASEAAAWEACDNHRMFGHPLGANRGLPAAGYHVAKTTLCEKGKPDVPGFLAISPEDDSIGHFLTEAAAWEACDRHRMFGSAYGLQVTVTDTDGALTPVPAPEPVFALETRRVVVLPTAHLSLSTCELLTSTPLESWPVAGGPIPFGFYVYAHDEGGAEGPADLQRCCTWANRQGFDYIQFDSDCDTPAPGLPVYDHNPRPPVDALEAFAKVRDLFEKTPGWLAHHIDWSPLNLLEAIAEAVGAPLNGKPAAPVAPTPWDNIQRYDEQLSAWEVCPTGDDFNNVVSMAQGGGYIAPTKGGR